MCGASADTGETRDERTGAFSRYVTVFHAYAGRLSAKALTATGWCAASRRISLVRRPRPDHSRGGSGLVADAQTEVCGWTSSIAEAEFADGGQRSVSVP